MQRSMVGQRRLRLFIVQSLRRIPPVQKVIQGLRWAWWIHTEVPGRRVGASCGQLYNCDWNELKDCH